MSRKLRALVYGDVNLNIIDGSAIWVASMAEALAGAGVDVTVLLKAPVETDRLVAPIEAMAGVDVIRPFETGLAQGTTQLSPVGAQHIMIDLDEKQRFDLVVIRGIRLFAPFGERGHFAGRMWFYLTEIPHSVTEFASWDSEKIRKAIELSRFMLCQTEELRDFLESQIDEACGRSVLWTPVVPDPEFDIPAREPLVNADGSQARPIRLVYTGKFAPMWNTLQMTALPSMLAARGIEAELHMIGDKIHDVPEDPGYSARMREALNSPGVMWHGGVARQRAMELTSACDLGLSWRAPHMDASLELSTKILEFGALDVPVILNRTGMHESLYGFDYPLFAADILDVVDAAETVVRDRATADRATAACRAVSEQYSMRVAIERMKGHLKRAFPLGADAAPQLAQRSERLKVVVASHDLKFFSRIQDHLAAEPEIDLRVDAWATLNDHDEAVSQELVAWADVVILEWAGPNAVWYSRHKRPGQRIIMRLHRFELDGPWLRDIEIGAIDQVICVSPHYAQLTRQRTGWPADKIVVIPNWVDVEMFSRPKLEGAPYTLGMIGIAPLRKRPDLGLKVLDSLRRRDPRFRLSIKSKQPWDYWWIWRRPEELTFFTKMYDHLRDTPRLHEATTFDGFGGDVPVWLRRIGWVLSTSDDESFHLAPAEGMASGAVPALLPWPGSDSIYDTRWIHADTDAMADSIFETVRSGHWQDEAADAHRQVRASFPLPMVCDEWTRVLVEDVSPDTAEGTLARD
jgi:glycosyltransferase involved in cell wall biosynthesis